MTHCFRICAAAALFTASGIATLVTPAAAGSLGCEIRTSTSGGMVALDSVVRSDASGSGSYTFRVTGSGTDIEQGGEFQANAGTPTPLGQVMLGKGRYKAELTVKAKTGTASCSKRIG